jgi:hypothetical protein
MSKVKLDLLESKIRKLEAEWVKLNKAFQKSCKHTYEVVSQWDGGYGIEQRIYSHHVCVKCDKEIKRRSNL